MALILVLPARAQDPCTDPATAPSWDNTLISNGDGTGELLNVMAPMGFARVWFDPVQRRNVTLLRPRTPDTNQPIPEFEPTGQNVPPFDPQTLGEGNTEWTYQGTSNPTELRLPIAAEHYGTSEATIWFTDTCGRSRAYDLVDGPLPVELVAFTALLDGRNAVLTWETGGEVGNLGFEVQHRSDADWQALGFVEGAGTTTFKQDYRFVARDLAPGTHHFRLKQIDAGGGVHYSPEVEVRVELPGAFELTPAYPNPFNPQATFSLAVRQTQHVRVALYDATGRQVALLFDGVLPADSPRTFTLDATGLPGGTYFYRATGETFAQTRSVTLLK
ncbi:MAG: hypothetical protein KatS3mg042_0471 [Rhodothermaceae bacterium]|nr:MAG: hypothetical protein KatS3mg042_0471 [Rhodothermaceae bacterium]